MRFPTALMDLGATVEQSGVLRSGRPRRQVDVDVCTSRARTRDDGTWAGSVGASAQARYRFD